MTLSSRARGLIGLAARARKLQSGAFAVEKCLKSGKAKLVLLDEGASENTVKQFVGLCRRASVPIALLARGELGDILNSAKICAVISDENFAGPLLNELSIL